MYKPMTSLKLNYTPLPPVPPPVGWDHLVNLLAQTLRGQVEITLNFGENAYIDRSGVTLLTQKGEEDSPRLLLRIYPEVGQYQDGQALVEGLFQAFSHAAMLEKYPQRITMQTYPSGRTAPKRIFPPREFTRLRRDWVRTVQARLSWKQANLDDFYAAMTTYLETCRTWARLVVTL